MYMSFSDLRIEYKNKMHYLDNKNHKVSLLIKRSFIEHLLNKINEITQTQYSLKYSTAQ